MHPMIPVSTYLELKQETFRRDRIGHQDGLDESYFLTERRFDQRPDPVFITLRRIWTKLSTAFDPGHNHTA